MTLREYRPEQLDQLSLRVLDLCGHVRLLAEKCRGADLSLAPLHDKKALEWLAKLEDWAVKTEHDVDLAIRRKAGAKRALELRENLRSK